MPWRPLLVPPLAPVLLFAALACLLVALPSAAQTPLTCGQPVAGEISAAGEVDTFTFAGEVGDVVTVSLWTTAATDPGFSARADVFAPGGATIVSNVSGLTDLPALTTAGTYTVRVRDYYFYGNRRGEDTVELQWRAPAARACGMTTLTCGAPVPGAIAHVGETKVYTFAGEVGDVVSVSLWTTQATDSGFSARADVFAPGGATIVSNVSGLTDLPALTTAGTYTVRVCDYYFYGNRRGEYTVELQWRAPAARACGMTTLTCGAPVPGAIAHVGETKVYTFAGEVGDVVSVSLWTTQATDSGFSARADVSRRVGPRLCRMCRA